MSAHTRACAKSALTAMWHRSCKRWSVGGGRLPIPAWKNSENLGWYQGRKSRISGRKGLSKIIVSQRVHPDQIEAGSGRAPFGHPHA